MTFRPTRRRALQALGGAGVLALAGCTSSQDAGHGSAGSSAATSSGGTATGTRSTASASARRGPVNWSKLRVSRPLLRPGQSAYAAAAPLYNPRFDAAAKPAAIAACATAQDVAACVRFAAEQGVPLRMRAGGHSYGGWSTGSGLVVDVRAMSQVHVDTAAGTATIGAGARLAQVYAGLAAAGKAIAGGSCPTVGITGLALGGGVGVLTGSFGLTCDSLQAVQLVTADGTLRTVDAKHDPDLFWALRGGGGGSFGAVTALTFVLRPAPTVTTYYYDFDYRHAETVLRAWQRWLPHTDRRLWSTCKLIADEQRILHAQLGGGWLGPSSSLGAQLAPLLSAIGAAPVVRVVGSHSYLAAMQLEAGCTGQSADSCISSALGPAKRLPFAATSSVVDDALPDAAITAAVAGARKGLALPYGTASGISFDSLVGAAHDVAAEATAFPHRKALALVQYTSTYRTGQSAAPFDSYVRGFRTTMSHWLGNAAYANYADPAIKDYATAYWGANYPKLQQVKRQYDPHSLFDFPQAVRP